MNCETGVNGDDNRPEEITVWSKMMTGFSDASWEIESDHDFDPLRYNIKIL
jgi:hypothetical protein